jgi:hypothetical protein
LHPVLMRILVRLAQVPMCRSIFSCSAV